MKGPRTLLATLLGLLLFAGASCPRRVVPTGPVAPIVFQATPTTAQIIQVVNQNTQRIAQLQTTDATLDVVGAPSLRASLAMERPQRFRMIARTGITGDEVDVGSNDEYFWFWARRASPPAVYYARHDQTYDPRVQSVMPIAPHWLVEAMGLVWLDPNRTYEGPFPRGPNQLELRYVEPTPYGSVTKLLVIDAQRGQISHLAVYGPNGQLMAAANCSNFQYDPVSLAWLPRQIDVQLPEAETQLTLTVDNYIINQLQADPAQLFSMPSIPGAPPVNLTEAAVN